MENVVTKKSRKHAKKYTYDEVFEASSAYFGNDPLPADVWADKYCLRDKEDNYLELTPDDMHDRLAHEFARIDAEKYGLDYDERFEIYRTAIDHFARIVPQGSPSAALGNPYQIMSASNCVVVEPPADSIAGIMKTGMELAQLYKRRCVEEKVLLYTKEKGPIPIKAVEVGMSVLSFDISSRKSVFKKVLDKFETEVSKKDRILVKFKSGAELKTSKKHPILIFNQGYVYKKAGELSPGDIGVQPEPKTQFNWTAKQSDIDLAWFVGCHLGDGSVDIRKPRYGQPTPRYRFRNLGDNEAVIAEYQRVFNKLSGSEANYHRAYRKDYRTECWEYSNSNLGNKALCARYIDGQSGKKTYTATTPSFIKENNLWWPYLAGLLDSDGWVKGGGQSIVLRLCAKEVIDEVSAFLMANGVGCRTYTIPPRKGRENEQMMYGVTIHGNNEFWPFISQYMHHNLKKALLLSKIVRVFSRTKPLSLKEAKEIETNYQTYSPKIAGSNLAACASILRRRARKAAPRAGIGMLNEFHKRKVINNQRRNEILQRNEVISITQDPTSQKYYDIVVEDTNNFFAGNLGLVNIHNCGVGTDLSELRPDGFRVNNAARTTSGAWSFADFYSYITRMIGQASRRGALMLTLDVHHPDIEKFAKMKSDLKKVTGANVSIRLSDEFMRAVETKGAYEQRWPCEGKAVFTKQVSAVQVWDTIVKTATETAEPGLIFWNAITNRLPAHAYPQFKTKSTNPCSEIALSSYDSCRLISINLTGYVLEAFTNPSFDWESFKGDIRTGMQMIDNLVDIELEQILKIQATCESQEERELWQKLYDSGEQGRRTGLGTHGLADMLAQLNIKYDSQEALDFCDKLYTILRDTSYTASLDLAEIRGPFPAFDWETEKNNEFIQDLPESIKKRMPGGRRNISILTQAPTGTTSMLSKCGEFHRHNISSGVEPIFRPKFGRRKKVSGNDGNQDVDFVDDLGDRWKTYTVYHGNILNYFEKVHGEAIEDLEDEATQVRLEALYESLPNIFVDAGSIDWRFRVKLQGVNQLKIDHSISSTINLPRGTEHSVVGNIYMDAWKNGLKGVTVYVDGSRDGVLITDEDDKIDPNMRPEKIVRMQSPKRPDELECDIHHHSVKGKKWTAFVGLLNGEPYEMFGGYSDAVHLPKKLKTGKLVRSGKGKYSLHIPLEDDEWVIKDVVGTFNNAELAWSTRLISASLRHGVPTEFLVEQLQKEGKLTDFNKVLARVLKKYIPDGEKVRSSATCAGIKQDGSICGSPNLIYQEGCLSCSDCGFAKCG